MKSIYLISCAMCLCLLTPVSSTSMPRASPEEMGMSAAKLKTMDEIVIKAIERKDIPGAVVGVVRNSKLVYLKPYGNKAVEPKEEIMVEDTVFDLASVSKPIGTGFSLMNLYSEGKFKLSDQVKMYLPDFQPYVNKATNETVHIRIIELFTHTSGLPAYANPEQVQEKIGEKSPEALQKYINIIDREFKPSTKYQYSCLNMVTLQNILQKLTGMKLEDYAQKHIFDVLGLESTTYNPITKKGKKFVERIAPTEKKEDGTFLKGEVNDPLARELNKGNSGNAGIFSTAEDLAIVASAVMSNGMFQKKSLSGKLALELMLRVPEGYEQFGRSLSWDVRSDPDGLSTIMGEMFTPGKTVGHTGYTGTSFMIDIGSKTAVILLTHCVHPTGSGKMIRLSSLIANIVAGSILE